MDIKIDRDSLPGLYKTADSASISEQKKYFIYIKLNITLLVLGTCFTYFDNFFDNPYSKLTSAIFFILSLAITLWLKFKKPDYYWYNSRALAESVKTRAWRWMLRTEPYNDTVDIEIIRKKFINDLKTILKQNKSLIENIGILSASDEPITEKMIKVRALSIEDRLKLYRQQRITNQALWYTQKSQYNKRMSNIWFGISVALHVVAIFMSLYNIKESTLNLPIEIIAISASGVITWLQSKKYNELHASYSLTAHEILLIKSEINRISKEEELSEYVMNCENAFSREHTQWFARKNE